MSCPDSEGGKQTVPCSVWWFFPFHGSVYFIGVPASWIVSEILFTLPWSLSISGEALRPCLHLGPLSVTRCWCNVPGSHLLTRIAHGRCCSLGYVLPKYKLEKAAECPTEMSACLKLSLSSSRAEVEKVCCHPRTDTYDLHTHTHTCPCGKATHLCGSQNLAQFSRGTRISWLAAAIVNILSSWAGSSRRDSFPRYLKVLFCHGLAKK